MNSRFGVVHGLALYLLSKLASFCLLSVIVGSSLSFLSSYFSFYNMIKPLSGAFGGLQGSLTAFMLGICFSLLRNSVFSWELLAHHIPGFFAALYWVQPSRVLQSFILLSCIALFIVHPVGGNALVYCAWWAIPVIFSFSSKSSLFLRSLGSTCVAHAVGSVIWLYAVNSMTAAAWIALTPISLAERFVFACGMVLMYHAYAYLVSTAQSIIFAARRVRA